MEGNGKKAFITGITGQDGSYLAEFLLNKGYEVHGLVRRVGIEDPGHRMSRLENVLGKVKLHSGTLESYSSLIDLFEKIKPDECYHLAAQSFVHESFDDGFSTFNTNINGTYHVLSALNLKAPACKLYFAASSEMFGKVVEVPQTEKTPFYPRSPYGISKLTGFELTRNFREAHNIFACSGLLFNHESPRRGYEFVTRKITSTIGRMAARKTNVLSLGNIDAKRDWGFAGDYVEAMWLMLQKEEPDDYVVATGETHSVREFLELSFNCAGLKYEIADLHDLGFEDADARIEDLKRNKDKMFVVLHPRFFRPADVELLIGNSSKARRELLWNPKVGFSGLVEMMTKNDIQKEYR